MSDLSPMNYALSFFPGAKQTSGGFWVRCCCHDERRASLKISELRNGAVGFKCFGCGAGFEEVVKAMGMNRSRLFSSEKRRDHRSKELSLVGSYVYLDENGQPYSRVRRLRGPEGKTFRQDRWENGKWVPGLGTVRPILYHLPEVRRAIEAGQPIWILEGEKDVDAARKLGLAATCNPMGAGKFLEHHAECLRGAMVCVVPDNDAPGRHHAASVASRCFGKASSVRVVELPGLTEKGADFSDWLAAGGAREQLEALAQTAPEWQPPATEEPRPILSPSGEWPPLAPITAPGVHPFPVEVLPQRTRDWVVAEARALQVPLDLPGVLALGACAVALGGRWLIRIRNGWEEPLNLYILAALPPAERKSAVFGDAMRPIEDYEADLQRTAGPAIAAARAELEVLKDRLKIAKRTASTTEALEDRRKAAALAEEIDAFVVPASPRLLADDCTPERLVGLLAEQDGRLGVASAEGGGLFDIAAGRYSTTGLPNVEALLKAHAGDTIRVDRTSRPPEFVRRPALTLVLATQPEVVRGLADRPGFRGRGLLARFLYSLPRSLVGSRVVDPPAMPSNVRATYESHLQQLLSLSQEEGEPRILRLEPQALALLQAFMRELEPRLGEMGDLAVIADWAGKLAGAVARIAGNLHVAEHGSRATELQVSRDCMGRAITLGHYFLSHALAAFDLMGLEAALAGARAVLPWLGRCEASTFTRRELHQAHRSRFPQSADLGPVLTVLEDRGAIRRREESNEPRVGRPSEVYEIHPALRNFCLIPASQNTQNTQNLVPKAENIALDLLAGIEVEEVTL